MAMNHLRLQRNLCRAHAPGSMWRGARSGVNLRMALGLEGRLVPAPFLGVQADFRPSRANSGRTPPNSAEVGDEVWPTRGRQR